MTNISGRVPPTSKDIRQQVLAALTCDRRQGRSAGRDPVRRGHDADALPGDGLVAGGGIALHRRQPGEPCRDAGARSQACRWSSGLGGAFEDIDGARDARRRAWPHGARCPDSSGAWQRFRKFSTAMASAAETAEAGCRSAGRDRERRPVP